MAMFSILCCHGDHIIKATVESSECRKGGEETGANKHEMYRVAWDGHLIVTRQLSCGKVMFSVVSIILFRSGGGGGVFPSDHYWNCRNLFIWEAAWLWPGPLDQVN